MTRTSRSPAPIGWTLGLALLALLATPVTGAQRAGAQARASDAAAALTAEQRAAIDAGRPVVVAEEVASSPWPRVTVTLFVDGTPEEAAAVFADYARHSAFLPNVKRSRVARQLDRATADVDYVLRVPLVADEAYTVRDRLTSYVMPAGTRGYQVSWTLVRASSTKAAEGEARFEPYRNERLGAEGTLLTYRNLVVPGSRLASLGFVRARARREVEATARALAAQVAKQRSSDRPLLEAQVRSLRSAHGETP